MTTILFLLFQVGLAALTIWSWVSHVERWRVSLLLHAGLLLALLGACALLLLLPADGENVGRIGALALDVLCGIILFGISQQALVSILVSWLGKQRAQSREEE